MLLVVAFWVKRNKCLFSHLLVQMEIMYTHKNDDHDGDDSSDYYVRRQFFFSEQE